MKKRIRLILTILLSLSGALPAAATDYETANDLLLVFLPLAPTNLVAEPGDGAAMLRWDYPHHASDDWQYRQNAGDWQDMPDADEYRVTGLTNGATYTFEVRAHNASGWGPASNTATVTLNAAPMITGLERASFAENGQGPVTTFLARDAEGDPITWSLSGRDAGAFTFTTDVERNTMEAGLETQMATNNSNEQQTLEVLGHSLVIDRLQEKVERVAKRSTKVLLLGEIGVGKGLLARVIHHKSLRCTKDFISVNCGALPPGLVESTLFGHEKGAFTSAVSQHIGYFEQAHGGTLFLDEIGDLPLDSQRVLLKVLEDRCLTRVGGRKSIPIDVRIVAATNRDLQRAIREKTFRDDLYYRLNVFPLRLPPLRDHQEDIPLLADYFLRWYAKEQQQSVLTLSDEALAYLQGYAWPGNVRELDHWIQRALIMCDGERIEVADVLTAEAMEAELSSSAATLPVAPEAEGAGAMQPVDEKQRIAEALRLTNWVVSGNRGAGRLLGMSAQTLRYRMRKYGIQRPKEELGPEDWERLSRQAIT